METFFLVVVFCVLFFLALREIFCWYWKVNDLLKNLVDINKKLGALNDKLASTYQIPPEHP